MESQKLSSLQRIKLYYGTLVIFQAIALACCKSDTEKPVNVQVRAVSFYPDSTLKHEVMLKNGQPEGLGINYFQSGKIRSKTYWRNGKEHGANVFYFENGNIEQENYYEHGIRQGISKTYYKNGVLKQLTILDSTGRIMDYYKYDSAGRRILSKDSKQPIILSVSDSIIIGESFNAEIRLGNHQYPLVDVYIGEVNRYILLNEKPLPKKDSLTALLSIRPTKLGPYEITGVVFERNEAEDSSQVISFAYPIFVKPK